MSIAIRLFMTICTDIYSLSKVKRVVSVTTTIYNLEELGSYHRWVVNWKILSIS